MITFFVIPLSTANCALKKLAAVIKNKKFFKTSELTKKAATFRHKT
jgi:hypothetical protein